MAQFRYKNTSLNTVVVIGIGQVAPNEVLVSDVEVNSPDLKPIQEEKPQAQTQAAQGTPMTEVTNAKGGNQ